MPSTSHSSTDAVCLGNGSFHHGPDISFSYNQTTQVELKAGMRSQTNSTFRGRDKEQQQASEIYRAGILLINASAFRSAAGVPEGNRDDESKICEYRLCMGKILFPLPQLNSCAS